MNIPFDAGQLYGSAAQLDAELTALYRQQLDAKRHALLEERRQKALALAAETRPLYVALGRDITTIESEAGWCDLHDAVDGAADAGTLTHEQAAELRARLRRAAQFKGWLSDEEAARWTAELGA